MGTINTKLPSPADMPRKSAFSDLSMSAGSVSFERLDKYHLKLSAAYGTNPTEYQSGVMMGIEIARGFAVSKTQNSN